MLLGESTVLNKEQTGQCSKALMMRGTNREKKSLLVAINRVSTR